MAYRKGNKCDFGIFWIPPPPQLVRWATIYPTTLYPVIIYPTTVYPFFLVSGMSPTMIADNHTENNTGVKPQSAIVSD